MGANGQDQSMKARIKEDNTETQAENMKVTRPESARSEQWSLSFPLRVDSARLLRSSGCADCPKEWDSFAYVRPALRWEDPAAQRSYGAGTGDR